MAKKKRQNKRPHIKQKHFRDRNISSLESHTRLGNRVRSPWSSIPGLTKMHSWYDECIPNIIWACILASHLERDVYLSHFRSVVINAREKLQNYKDGFVTHNYLALLSNEDFDRMFEVILADEEARKCLSVLRLIECLPDKFHWDRHLPVPSPEDAGRTLVHAVGETFDHQSEKSTDIRWMKVMYLLCCERVVVAKQMAERMEEFRLYPNKGDMRAVRPSIRSMEIGFRQFEYDEEKPKNITLPPNHRDQFWREMKTKTGCIIGERFEPPKAGAREIVLEIAALLKAAEDHFESTMVTTAPDPRHDGAFGLCLYAISLLLNAANGFGHSLAEGRIILRSIVEAFITLQFLAAKDDQTIWMQYRRFGSGQAKLTFLKNIREEDVPDFIDLKKLELLANEDMWMEFEDIQLGNWANLNLRKMAEEAGVKDTYDKFYDWASGYAHGHWVSVRDAVFVNCLNPLHRFHRIPGPPIPSMPSILFDGAGLVNRMLDTLGGLYPSFTVRLKSHRGPEQPKAPEEPSASS